MKENKKFTFQRFVIISVMALIFIISLATLGIIFYFFKEGNAYIEECTESTLLATGLSIIGLAVAVWSGLNIANSIQKKEIDDMKTDVAQLLDDTEKLKTKSKDIAQTFGRVGYKDLFFQELLRKSQDYATLYLCNEIKKKFADYTNLDIPWEELVIIERLYTDVYRLHNGRNKYNDLLIDKSSEGIRRCDDLFENLKGKDDFNIFYKYFNIRRGDFNFYKGYAEKTPRKIFSSFKAAINKYLLLLENDIEINKHTCLYDFSKIYKSDADFLVYVINTIGESYSKISQYYEKIKENFFENSTDMRFLEECPQKAIDYCIAAVNLLSETTFHNNEMYFRNLGCAYERFDKTIDKEKCFDHSKEIFENYKTAFSLMVRDDSILLYRIQSVYQVLLSYYNRYLRNALNIEFKNNELCKIENLKLDNDSISKITEFIAYSAFSLEDNRKNNLLIVMNGFAYAYAAITIKISNAVYDFALDYCLEKMSVAINQLKIVQMSKPDDYTKQLCSLYNYVMNL